MQPENIELTIYRAGGEAVDLAWPACWRVPVPGDSIVVGSGAWDVVRAEFDPTEAKVRVWVQR